MAINFDRLITLGQNTQTCKSAEQSNFGTRLNPEAWESVLQKTLKDKHVKV